MGCHFHSNWKNNWLYVYKTVDCNLTILGLHLGLKFVGLIGFNSTSVILYKNPSA